MKKRIITATAFTACLALCAAVWPQSEPAKETPALPTLPVVTAAQPKVPEIPEIEEIIMPEEEAVETTESEQAGETIDTPEPSPVHVPPVEETIDAPVQESEAAPTSPDTPPDNMVYVPGFGWLENQGPNHCEYAEDMYENGNKIGIMG